jgi:hypothetical protein
MNGMTTLARTWVILAIFPRNRKQIAVVMTLAKISSPRRNSWSAATTRWSSISAIY